MITDQTKLSLREVADRLLELDNFVLCGHVSPDGDCIGSQLTLYHALRSVGKKVTCVLASTEQVDDDLSFLPGANEMIPASAYEMAPGVFVACDVPTSNRLGDAAELQARSEVTFTIDHHANDVMMSQFNYIDPDAASTTMIMWDLVRELGVEPNADIALCAYTGLVTDTGGFAYQNTDVAAFQAASKMVETGINPSEVSRNVFQSRTLASLQLEGIALDRMMLSKDNSYALSFLTIDDFDRVKGEKSDVDPVVNVLRSLKGIRVACLLREQTDGIRGSMRAKDDTDVSVIARHFGGGGHKAAAGFTFSGSIDEAITAVKHALDEVI